jgi:hypothetical protein
MARKVSTVEELLSKMPTYQLLNINNELIKHVVPVKGEARSYIRSINNMIDRGTLCISATTYRKLYLPTFTRMVFKEMARRYADTLSY